MSSRGALAIVASLPAVAVALVGMWGVVSNPSGGWVWPPDTVNVSEAAATGNYAELVRLLEAGEDPNRSHPVRAPLLSGRPVDATPIEAAVEVRNADMLELLLDHGTVMTSSLAGRLKCLNERHADADVRAILDRYAPGDPVCTAVE